MLKLLSNEIAPSSALAAMAGGWAPRMRPAGRGRGLGKMPRRRVVLLIEE